MDASTVPGLVCPQGHITEDFIIEHFHLTLPAVFTNALVSFLVNNTSIESWTCQSKLTEYWYLHIADIM